MSQDGDKPKKAGGKPQYDFNEIIGSIMRDVLSELWLANERGEYPCVWARGGPIVAPLRQPKKSTSRQK